MRGKLCIRLNTLQDDRITPAHAGKTGGTLSAYREA